MSKPVNTSLIGSFVIGALILIVLAIVTIGGDRFFTQKMKYVMYFENSVSGLYVGAPVEFKGVKVGYVSDILIEIDHNDQQIHTPVYVNLMRDQLITVNGRDNPEQTLQALIVRGLRAQLNIQSIVTGQLRVELDFHPKTALNLLGQDPKHPELPTIPSDLQKLSNTASKAIATFENLPFEDLFNKLLLAAEGIERTVNSPELHSALVNLNESLVELKSFTNTMNQHVEPLTTNITDAAIAIKSAVIQAESTLSKIDKTVDSSSPLHHEMERSMREMSQAASSIRSLAEYLERNPNAIIYGK